MSGSRATGGGALLKQRLGGLVFLAVLVGLIGLSIAFYQKTFTPVVNVTLEADRAGNQLTPPADVKVDGVIVGEAREVQATPNGAKITLALDPSKIKLIPGNVRAQLLPKTLFGEKFVSLVRPDNPTGTLHAGSVIPQDRSTTAVETETATNDLLPLLRTLKPQVLSTTLNRVSSALRGRGDQIGDNLQLTRDYLKQFNPEIPTLGQDMSGLADFADTVNAAEPDIVNLLDNSSVLGRNLVAEQAQLDAFLRTSTSSTGTLDQFLRDNKQRFIDLPATSRPVLDVYARYAPEFPCLAKGLTKAEGYIADSFGTLQPGLHITLEITKDQGGYTPGADEPEYLDDRGPVCYGLPDPQVPAPDTNYRDGYRDDPPSTGTSTYGPSGSSGSSASYATASFSTASAFRTALNADIAPALGVDAAAVPDVARLLLGPAATSSTSRSAS